jgi:hypothetical protein
MGESSKIDLGHGATEVLDVATKLTIKHKADGTTSPLLTLTDINWALITDSVPLAEAKHNEAETLRAKAEKAYRDRDLLLEPIEDAVRRSKNLLKSIHSKNPKILTEWGFNVTYTAATTKAAKAEKAAKATKASKTTKISENNEEL